MNVSEVLTMIEEKGVRFVDLRFTDTRGKEQHVSLPSSVIDEEFFATGKMFDGSSIAGWLRPMPARTALWQAMEAARASSCSLRMPSYAIRSRGLSAVRRESSCRRKPDAELRGFT